MHASFENSYFASNLANLLIFVSTDSGKKSFGVSLKNVCINIS